MPESRPGSVYVDVVNEELKTLTKPLMDKENGLSRSDRESFSCRACGVRV